MHKASPSHPKPGVRKDARERLLEAAGRVFAREGIGAGTTRQIAHAAEVNEVTLFRLFGTKEALLDAVVRRTMPEVRRRSAPPAPSRNLRADLAAFGRRHERLLKENLPLIRALAGDAHRHQDHARDALVGVFKPLREALVERLAQASAAGEIHLSVHPEIAADLFHGAIFAGVFRRACAAVPRSYSARAYTRGCVDLFYKSLALGQVHAGSKE